jgi:bile acid:Na+ symporter, BASS family
MGRGQDVAGSARARDAFRARWPELGEALNDRILRIAGLALVACGLALLAAHWDAFARLPWQGIAALIVLMLIALAIGHLLGGPDPDNRTTLAITCATRHIGLAVLVATAVPGPRTAVLIAGYLLCTMLVSIPYLHWRRRAAHA